MKKLLFILTMVLMLMAGGAVMAGDSVSEAPDIRIQIDGVTGSYTLNPITVNDRTLLPLREILVKLGVPDDDAHIIWDGSLNTVTIVNGDTHLGLTVGSNTAIVNGKPVTLDAAPVLHKDRVFIPARFVAQSLGKHVDWNSASSTVRILTVSPDKQNTINVSTVDEFLSAIAPDTRILLAPGVYNLSEASANVKLHTGVTFEKVSDGAELNLTDISNLTIEGKESMAEGKTAEIRVNPRYAAVIHLTNCTAFTLSKIKAGHTPEPYHCNAGVIEAEKSNGLTIRDSELYGCGSVGLSAFSCYNLTMSGTTIDHCSFCAMWLYDCHDVAIKDSSFLNNEAYADILSLTRSTRVVFEKCRIAGNHAMTWSVVSSKDNSEVRFQTCTFEDNIQPVDATSSKCIFLDNLDYNKRVTSSITIKNCVFKNNSTDYLGYNNAFLIIDGSSSFDKNSFD